jgi:hypothetical protein
MSEVHIRLEKTVHKSNAADICFQGEWMAFRVSISNTAVEAIVRDTFGSVIGLFSFASPLNHLIDKIEWAVTKNENGAERRIHMP